jgi:CheY-like chemotaxis protein
MKQEVVILITEDDLGHASLITKNLKRSGISNEIIHFKDGEELISFLFNKGKGKHLESGKAYLLLLDIRMPKMDGFEVLDIIKKDSELKKIPVIIITTTDNTKEMDRCHKLGCNNYLTKPVNYENFVESINRLGLFLKILEIPKISEKKIIKEEGD